MRRALVIMLLLGVARLHAVQAVSDLAGQSSPLEVTGGSARAYGMGSAFVAVPNDSSAMLFNPAALGGMKAWDVGIHHQTYLLDSFQEIVTLGIPLGDLGGIGLYGGMIDFGEFERRNAQNQIIGSDKASRISVGLGYGYSWKGILKVGLTGRGMFQTLGDTSNSTFAGDVGAEWDSGAGLRIGAALVNLGADVGEDPLQNGINVGAAYQIPFSKTQKFGVLLAADGSIEPSGVNRYKFGTEISYAKSYFVRVGYLLNGQNNEIGGLKGLTAGGGIKYAGLGFDYAYVPFGEIGITHRVSVSWAYDAGGTSPVVDEIEKRDEPEVEPKPIAPKPESKSRLELEFSIPSDPFSMAKQYEKQGRNSEAGKAYLEAIKAEPRNAKYRKALGDLFYKLGKHEHAITTYKQVLQLQPGADKLRKWLENYERRWGNPSKQ